MALLVPEENMSNTDAMRQKVHHWIFIAAISFLAIGLSTSKVFISIAELVLGLNWIAEGNYSTKWKRFTGNKPALVLCSFYIMHLLGMLYSTDYSFGIEDIRVKIPLLILPFMFCTTDALNEKERNLVFGLYTGTLTVVSFIGLYRIKHHLFIDIHQIVPYVSSIRLALMMVLSILLLLGYVFSRKWSWLSWVLIIWALWLFVFLFIMESLTGIVMMGILGLLLVVYFAIKEIKRKRIFIGTALLLFIGLMAVGSIGYVIHFYHKYFPEPDKSEYVMTDMYSAKGQPYYTGPAFEGVENGHVVKRYVSPGELSDIWNRRSKMPYDSLDKKGNGIQFTLVRYLTSMNLRKDSTGISKLTATDIKAIENGIPNYNFATASNMQFRLYQAFWEIEDYKQGGNLSGHSITQRIEFWRAAIGIIKKHWLIGVGTGDVKKAFAAQYEAMHTNLSMDFRLRSHNQYLEIGVASGVVGIIWLLFSVIYPGIKTRKLYTYAYFVFWAIFVMSMFSEDTLETQAGATFYAFFNSFFLFLV